MPMEMFVAHGLFLNIVSSVELLDFKSSEAQLQFGWERSMDKNGTFSLRCTQFPTVRLDEIYMVDHSITHSVPKANSHSSVM